MVISRFRILGLGVALFLSLQVIFLQVPQVLAATSGGTLYALMTDNFGPPPPLPNSMIEIVDLSTMSLIRTIPLGQSIVSSLAVSPGGDRLYVVDQHAGTAGAIRVIASLSGNSITNVSASAPRDEVLSADGSTLYATAGTTIVAIDTTTFAVTHNMTTGSDTGLGIALSPDGSILGTPSTAGGSNPALYLVNTAGFTLRARIPIAGNTMGCGTFPNDVAFTDTGRALLWDSNCDAYYQVDTSSNTQLIASTVNFPRSGASSGNYNNAIYYSAVSARAYALIPSASSAPNNLTVMNPAAATGSAVDQFSGIPFVPTLHPDGKSLFISVIHRFSGGGADTLDQYDTLSGVFARNVYTFSRPSMSVRDIKVQVAPPSAPLALTATAGPKGISLGWTAPGFNGGEAIMGYKIYRSTTSGGEKGGNYTLTTIGNVTSYLDTNVLTGTVYYYKVSAYNGFGESQMSTEATSSPSSPTASSTPQNLQATAGTNQITLSWIAPSSNGGTVIIGYNVYRGTATGKEGATPFAILGNVTAYTDLSATAGATYYYRVTAINGFGESVQSIEATAATPAAPTPTGGFPTWLYTSAGLISGIAVGVVAARLLSGRKPSQ